MPRIFHLDFNTKVLYFCVGFQKLSHLTRDLSQAEKKLNVDTYKLSKCTKWHLFHSKGLQLSFWVKNWHSVVSLVYKYIQNGTILISFATSNLLLKTSFITQIVPLGFLWERLICSPICIYTQLSFTNPLELHYIFSKFPLIINPAFSWFFFRSTSTRSSRPKDYMNAHELGNEEVSLENV